jgi:TolB-like protein/Tfp pilus assembly protein PilF
MGKFFSELKRRHVYRVGAAYAVVAWVLIQLVNNIAPALKLPDWAVTLVLVLLFVGFPIALLFAWIHQLAPADGAMARESAGKLDWVLAGSLIVVIGLVSYQQFAPSNGARTAQRQASVTPGDPGGALSIAVLPFVNLSGDAGQEFFSDGMTEEITSALAKVPNLRVVARTSAFQFKGENRDIQAIAQALHATHLIEGSVRKDGNQLRITAQLIKADDGTHLWTESYDRELKGVFAVQEEIASAIAGALRVPLGLRQGEALVSNRTNDLDSYQQYLRARSLVRARAIGDAIKVLEPVVARDPSYAPAWGLLALAYALAPTFSSPGLRSAPLEQMRRIVQSTTDKAEMAAREAIRLDPKHPGAYVGQAFAEGFRRARYAAAEGLFRQALTLDPNDPGALDWYSYMLGTAGRLKDSLRLREQLQTLEPFVPIYNINTGIIVYASGQDQAAIKVLEAVPSGGVTSYLRNNNLARAYAAEGRYAEAADTLLATPQNQSPYSRRSLEDAARLLRGAPAATKAPDALPALEEGLDFVYAFVGAPDRLLEYYERLVATNFAIGIGFPHLWHPLYAPLRKTERFKTLMRNAGLVEYWRTRGWPDLCRPVGTDDFVCE